MSLLQQTVQGSSAKKTRQPYNLPAIMWHQKMTQRQELDDLGSSAALGCNSVPSHGNSIYAVDNDRCRPWAQGKLHGEDEDIRSPVPSDVMMEMRSATSQPQPTPQCLKEYKTEFHPHSNWPPLFQSLDEFHVHTKTFTPPMDDTPYYPFQVEGDFKFMEVALAASLNQAQVDKLLNLISHVAQGTAQVTLKNNGELHKACNATAATLTVSSRGVKEVPRGT
ncbi:hypothetical protein EV401DRAFT_1895697 [Pisolithus croceorrhizus]|nr:hypothetical protein EV401DRAFT_1895697 [Pisolithus croceorrhizus]